MLPLEALLAPLRGLQASFYIESSILLNRINKLATGDSFNLKKAEKMLNEQLALRFKLYATIYDILSEVKREKQAKYDQHNSDFFGFNEETKAHQKPLLLARSLSKQVSFTAESLAIRVTTAMFRARERFLGTEEGRGAPRDFGYGAIYKLFGTLQGAQLYGLLKAADGFVDHGLKIVNNISSCISTTPAVLRRVQLLVSRVKASEKDVKTLQDLYTGAKSENRQLNQDEQAEFRKALERIFFSEPRIPQILAALGLQVFRTRECIAIQNERMKETKCYEHVSFEAAAAVEAVQDPESPERLPAVKTYTACCPGCCIEQNFAGDFEALHNNVEHARSYLSGRILRFGERQIGEKKHGFALAWMYAEPGTQAYELFCGFLTPEEYAQELYRPQDGGTVQAHIYRKMD